MRTRSEWVHRDLGWTQPGAGTIHDNYFRHMVPVVAQVRPSISGGVIDDWQLQDLAMCPAGGTVVASLDPTQSEFVIKGTHASLIQAQRRNEVVIKSQGTDLLLFINWVMFDKARVPAGLGGCALLRAAQAAKRLGLSRIELLAAGGSGAKGIPWNTGYNGYYSWPCFGFNAPLQPAILQQVRATPGLNHCTDVLDIMEVDTTWWKNHGDGCLMTFDLADNSRSWQTLTHYLHHKGLAT